MPIVNTDTLSATDLNNLVALIPQTFSTIDKAARAVYDDLLARGYVHLASPGVYTLTPSGQSAIDSSGRRDVYFLKLAGSGQFKPTGVHLVRAFSNLEVKGLCASGKGSFTVSPAGVAAIAAADNATIATVG